MAAELVRQDQIANDLANASTPGYKPDRSAQRSFGELLLSNKKTGAVVGPMGLGAQIAEIRTDFSQGALKETGEPLDLALNGPGFFAVKTKEGIRYTRNGQFMLDAEGRLTTAGGHAALDASGKEIRVPSGQNVAIGPDGTVTVAGKPTGKLAVVSLKDPHKEGASLFSGKATAATDTTVRQGFLEQSAIDPVRTMIDMLASLRAFESTQRVIHAIDETLGKGINSAGATG